MNIRRNTIVRHKDKHFYGRVIRKLPDNKIFWLCCGYHFHITDASDLVVDGYRGTKDFRTGRFVPMTSLRNLKRRCSRYHRGYSFNTPLDYEYIQYD